MMKTRLIKKGLQPFIDRYLQTYHEHKMFYWTHEGPETMRLHGSAIVIELTHAIIWTLENH
jgi:hypothetical protein